MEWLQDPVHLAILGAALIVAIFLLVTLVKWRRNHAPIVPFRAQGGRVEIAPRTLRNLINHAVMGVPGVEKLHSKFGTRRRKLHIHCYLDLMATAKLPEVEAELKHRIREALRNQFGLENIGDIDVTVKKIVGDPPVAPRTPLLESRRDTTTKTSSPSHLVSHSETEPQRNASATKTYETTKVDEAGAYDETDNLEAREAEEEESKKRLG
ncbi:MAG: hypothetical protein Q7P63_09475 [Verrucomicrobiota bacterium JB022]|nr:hypothetical protein [Verrucomicrobiota bacterium JB022]